MSFQMRIPVLLDEYGNKEYVDVPKHFVYYDWFFGTEDEFVIPNEQGYSISQSLKTFESSIPILRILWIIPLNLVDNSSTQFTPEDLALLRANNSKLVLAVQDMIVKIEGTAWDVCVQPIRSNVLLDSLKTDWPGKPNNVDETVICWNYLPLHLTASSEAPDLNIGFNQVKYPNDYLNPCLRIGKKQIEMANSKSSPLDGQSVSSQTCNCIFNPSCTGYLVE